MPKTKLPFSYILYALITIFSTQVVTAQPITSPEPGSNFASSTVTFNWSAGVARYFLYVGTSPGTYDLYYSDYISAGTLSKQVTGLPTDSIVYVRLWSETGVGTGRFYIYDYTYNSDIDNDGILDSIDPNPVVTDPIVTRVGSDHVLEVLGSGRIASMESAALFASTYDDIDTNEMRAITKRVYEHFDDQFDFIIVASNQSTVPTGSYYGRFYNARNDIQGIGKSTFDYTSLFGSNGQLQGAIHLTSSAGLRSGPSLHELAHNWGNSMNSVSTTVGGHWGYANIGGQLGGWLPGSLIDLGGGQYQARNPGTGALTGFGGNANGGNSLAYSKFELYTMGLITANEVDHDIKIANGFSWVDYNTGTFSATSITTRTMTDVVTLDGARIPDPTTSQKNFSVLYLILTDSPLTLAEWSDFDQDVERFGLPGDDGTYSYNFYEATGGRASLTMDGLLAAISTLSFQISNIVINPGEPRTATVTIPSELGKTYTLEYSTTLGEWNDGASAEGNGGDLSLQHTIGTASEMFFRVRGD